MLLQISDLLPRLQIYERLFPGHERLVQALSLIYCDILDFCSEAKAALRKPRRAMLSSTWKSFERQFGQQLKSFQRHQGLVEKEANASHMIEWTEASKEVRVGHLQATTQEKGRP